MLPKKHISYPLSDSRKSSEDEGKQSKKQHNGVKLHVANDAKRTFFTKWHLWKVFSDCFGQPQWNVEEISPNLRAEGWELGWQAPSHGEVVEAVAQSSIVDKEVSRVNSEITHWHLWWGCTDHQFRGDKITWDVYDSLADFVSGAKNFS